MASRSNSNSKNSSPLGVLTERTNNSNNSNNSSSQKALPAILSRKRKAEAPLEMVSKNFRTGALTIFG